MFGSDNQAAVHPKVMAAITEANIGATSSYSSDDWCTRARDLLAQSFETHDIDIYFVATGGAANGLGLSLLCPPWGAILTHNQSHLIHDESTGIALFTGGAALVGVGAPMGRLECGDIEAAMASYDAAFVHGLQPKAVSIANLSENGLTYSAQEIAALATVAKVHGLNMHVDGARLANAAAFSGSSLAALTWQAGVDVVSFGLTKNGAMMAEALLVFGRARTQAAAYMQKRSGHLLSKSRYIGAQFCAMLDDGLFMQCARHANAMAQQLALACAKHGYPPLLPVEGNEVFVALPEALSAALLSAGITHYPWPSFGSASQLPYGYRAYRFVASWCSSADDIAAFDRIVTHL